MTDPLAYSELDDEVPRRRNNKGLVIAIGAAALAGLVIFLVARGGGGDTEVHVPAPPDKIVMQADPPKPVDPPKPEPEPEPVVVEPTVVDPPVVVDEPPVEKKPIVVKKPDVKKPEIKPEPPVEPPKKEAISAAALYSLYQSVGSDLAVVAKSNPTVASAVELDYRRIQIQDAMSSEESRVRNAAQLEKMRARLVAARSKKP